MIETLDPDPWHDGLHDQALRYTGLLDLAEANRQGRDNALCDKRFRTIEVLAELHFESYPECPRLPVPGSLGVVRAQEREEAT